MTDKTTYTSVGSLRNSGWRSEAEDSLIRSGQVVIGFAGAGGNDSQADTGLIPGIFSTHAIEINPELSTSVTEVSRSTGNHDGFDRFCRARDAGSVSAADWIEQIKRIWAHGPASTLVLARAVAAAKDPVLRLTLSPSMKSWSVIGCCLSTVLPAIPVTTDRWSEGCGKAALDQ